MSKWYILQVYSGQEQKVKVQIEGQTLKKGLRQNIEEILIPSEEVIEMKKGKKVNSERRFFPGYILIKMIMNDDLWHTIRNIPKVSGFIGGKKGIEAKIHYPIPMYLQESLKKLKHKWGDFPVTDSHTKNIITFPCDQHLNLKQRNYVIKTVENFYKKY